MTSNPTGRAGLDHGWTVGVGDLVAPAAGDGSALPVAEADGGDADAAGEEAGEVGGVVVADAAGDGGDGEFGGGEEFFGAAQADAEEVVLGAASGAAADGGAQFGGGHAVPGGVFGDGQGLEGVAGEGLEDFVAVGGEVGAGAAQGDEEFVDGGAGLHFQEGVAAAGGAGDAADDGAGGARVGERYDGPVGFDVAEFGVRGCRGSGEVDEALVPAGVGPVVVWCAGGEPDQGGCGDGVAVSVGGAVPAAARADDDGDVVVEGAGSDDGQFAVLEADTEAGEAEAVVGWSGSEIAHPGVVHPVSSCPARYCLRPISDDLCPWTW